MKLIKRAQNMLDDATYSDIVHKYADAIGTRINDSVIDIAKDCGSEWSTIEQWEAEDKDVRDILTIARRKRAWAMMCEAQKQLHAVDLVDTKTGKIVRNATAKMHKAKVMADVYQMFAGFLAPDVFGDYRYELKQIQNDIKSLQKAMAR
jgi:predicted nucleotidyltransferase